MTPRVLLDVHEVAATLGCGKTFVYELLAHGELRALKLGRLTRIPLTSVEDLIARKLAEPGFDRESSSSYTRSVTSGS